MAKQVGPYPLTGLLSNVSMYKSPFGYLAREVGGHNRSRVLKHPRFQRTRENAVEFKNAILGATLLRRCLGKSLAPVANSWLSGRMNGLMFQMVRSDKGHLRGKRNVGCGDTELLESFEFNHLAPLNVVLPVRYGTTMDAEAGTMELILSSFIPRERMKLEGGATHFRIISIGATLDFEKGKYKRSEELSGLLAIGRDEVEMICMKHELIVAKDEVVLLVMGVLFYKVDEKGVAKVLKSGAMRLLQAGESN